MNLNTLKLYLHARNYENTELSIVKEILQCYRVLYLSTRRIKANIYISQVNNPKLIMNLKKFHLKSYTI
jgi:hypothetical protein